MPPLIVVRVAASICSAVLLRARAAWQMELSGSGGLTKLPVRCWRARLKWRVYAVANRSYEAEMRAAGVSAAIYERKKQAPRGLVQV